MTTRSKIRCASCKKRIPRQAPDLMLTDIATGKKRYYHLSCEEGIANLILRDPATYVLVRTVEAEAN